ncbi:methyltransferase domain-containing protein [Hydrogenophaga sp. PBL-H3]|uniref:methyltransferase domain-containing protein n=1 Tax=Hydrogenophaga sp. PBL-H3 TaxID=434010 RepID=UPI00132029B8|nr:methyltransferase domain-containing protein [Hydrogenophaga sp. PBL-H3]QHE76701.1 methyltransferase domain-containing protein [Hydrogenophaga sp. PBL-H3]QHE81125.1 methyltransferase domain-containing protein [Hydrogenophaga sp. PBL-H3]
MTNTNTGSYQFEALNDAQFQTQRLQQQAQAVRSLETSILRGAGIQPTHDVLEIGSGPGFVSDLLAELAPQGSLHAVEPSPTLIAQLEGNVRQKPARGLFSHQAYGDALPLADQSIDFSYTRFVLQHVPKPQAVVQEVFRVTRPGGRFCAVDSDDGLVLFHPGEPRVDHVLHSAQSIQASQGGDRFIGRKMQEMMLQAGFTKVKTRVMMLTSSELPFPVLFNILLGYKASLLGDAVDLAKLFEDLSADVAAGRRLVAAGVFIVSGERA